MENMLLQTLRFSLPTISCASCVRTIESTLEKTKGVERATVNFAERSLTVQTTLSSDEIIRIMKQTGYEALVLDEKINTIDENTLHYHRLLLKASISGFFGIILLILGWSQLIPPLTARMGQFIWGGLGLITLFIMVYAGGHIYRGAFRMLLKFTTNMDTLIAMGTGAAWIYSMMITIAPFIVPLQAQHVYFEAAVIILAFIDLGAALEIKARGKTSDAIKRLIGLQPKTARIVRGEEEIDLPIEQVQVGDVIRVRPGEKIAVDGVIIEGRPTIDESMLTGESMPVTKELNQKVVGGTMNKTGTFLFKATQIGKETVLAQIIHLVKDAQNTKPPIAKLVDQISSIFVPTVMVIAIVTAIIWYFVGPAPSISYMLVASMSVLVIACPCALGLATPISIMVAMGKAAEHGVLIRNGEVLQLATQLNTIVLDKTGTITVGQPRITALYPVNDADEETLLKWAASVETGSEHPLATAILEATKEKNYSLYPTTDFQALVGEGVTAKIKSHHVLLGNALLMKNQNIDIECVREKSTEWMRLGYTIIHLAIDQKLMGIIGISDPVRTNSQSAIARLKKRGIEIIMLTGDNETTAKSIADQVGIQNYIANILPSDKSEQIKKLQAQHKIVGMVGDGINDAPALAQANIGFALSTGTDIAIESSDITLIRNSLDGVADAIEISKLTMRNIKQNLFSAFIYNIVAIPVAAGVLYPFIKLLLNPMIAGAAMALSSLTVVTNANRLRGILGKKKNHA